MAEPKKQKARSERAGIDRADAAPPPHALTKIVQVLGTAYTASGDRIGYAIRLRKSKRAPAVCPIHLTGRHNGAGLERWLLDTGHESVLSVLKVSDVGEAIRDAAGKKKVVVVESRGFHEVMVDGRATFAMCWDGKLRFLGEHPEQEVLLVEDAAKREQHVGSVKTWLASFTDAITGNPSLLVALCVALSAATRRALREPAFTLAYIAPSSTGKSTLQLVCSTLLGPPDVPTWNATRFGLEEQLADMPDRPAFIQDLHEADKPTDVARIIMSVGNSAKRKRSQHAQGSGKSKSIQTTLIVSSEHSIASLLPSGSAGILARCFEIHAREGAFGMFDDLGDFEGGGIFAAHLERLASQHYGLIWPAWLKRLESDWPKVQRWHTERLPTLRIAIMKAAQITATDALTGRLVDRLAFAAFNGCVATELKLWSIKRPVIVKAFGSVLRDHVRRSPPSRNALADAAIEAVRGYIEAYAAKFPPVSSASDPNRQSGISGYVGDVEGETLRLFIPDVFRKLFVDVFTDEIYTTLKAVGFLVTSGTRHNLFEKKIRVGPEKRRRSMFFVAIREDIRYAPMAP